VTVPHVEGRGAGEKNGGATASNLKDLRTRSGVGGRSQTEKWAQLSFSDRAKRVEGKKKGINLTGSGGPKKLQEVILGILSKFGLSPPKRTC